MTKTQERNAKDGGRSCWKSARERERLRARFEIRDRVATGAAAVIVEQDDERGYLDVETAALFLRHVADGSVSSFSLAKLAKQVSLLTRPLPSSMISEYKIKTLCTSRFGVKYAQQVLAFSAARDTLTIIEYASLVGEYRIVGALLLGGIDPTVAGAFADNPWPQNQPTTVPKHLAVRILRRFFDCFPTALKAYIIKRVVEMRLYGWIHHHEGLCFGEPCFHNFTEEKLWIDILNRIDEPDDVNDVVCCPICGTLSQSADYNKDSNTPSIEETSSPSERRKLTLIKYQSLPATSNELKAISKGKGRKKPAVASSWRDALAHCLGNSKDVRTDKFFASAERGSLHYVRGCLENGVDVHVVNEYGQTALYLAAWRGHLSVVDLLLQFGADPAVASNGGSTALDVASANGHADIASAISSFLGIDETIQHDSSGLQSQVDWPKATVHVLICMTANHPGAGSYTIDNCMEECHLKALVDLRGTLPVAMSDKKKKKNVELCSDRFYYSDAHGWIRRLLETTIARNVSNAIVLPHMRFLAYDRAGSSLAPHVDLCRVDTNSGQRSTHTFILYLYSCTLGGETILLESLTSTVPMANVKPTRGRLLLFPHNCPHMGAEVVDVPKLLLRGEVILETPQSPLDDR